MKLHGYEIKENKIIQNGTFVSAGWQVYKPFKKVEPYKTFATKAEAIQFVKDEFFERIDLAKNRYTTYHYSQYYWCIADNNNGGMYVRKDNGKLLLFNKRDDALEWCNKHN